MRKGSYSEELAKNVDDTVNLVCQITTCPFQRDVNRDGSRTNMVHFWKRARDGSNR